MIKIIIELTPKLTPIDVEVELHPVECLMFVEALVRLIEREYQTCSCSCGKLCKKYFRIQSFVESKIYANQNEASFFITSINQKIRTYINIISSNISTTP